MQPIRAKSEITTSLLAQRNGQSSHATDGHNDFILRTMLDDSIRRQKLRSKGSVK